MNTFPISTSCGHNNSFSIEQVVKEIAAQIKLVSADLEVTRTELIFARTRAQNCFKQAVKFAEDFESNCDHATFDQRQMRLYESDREAMLAADEYIELMETVKHLSTELHNMSASHAIALGVLQGQEKIEEPQ